MITQTFFTADHQELLVAEQLASEIKEAVSLDCSPQKCSLVFLLVGSPTSMGDALGPMVGDILTQRSFAGDFYGTTSKPLDARTLNVARWQAVHRIRGSGKRPYLIVVDAALGTQGLIRLREGPVRPGSGVRNSGVSFGDLAILGYTTPDPRDFKRRRIRGWLADTASAWLDQAPPDLVRSMAEIISEAIISFEQMWDDHHMEEYAIASAAQEAD